MKRISLLLPALLLFLLASCGPKLTPTQLNDKIVNTNDSLMLMGQTWTTALGNAFMSKDYTTLVPIRESIGKFLDGKIEEMDNMKDVGGSEEFRKEEVEFLKYERGMVDQAFMPFEKFNANTTMDEIQTLANSLVSVSTTENEKMNQLKVLQQQYSDKNKFKLKENPVKANATGESAPQ